MSHDVPPDSPLLFRSHAARRLPHADVTGRAPRILVRLTLLSTVIVSGLVVIAAMFIDDGPKWSPFYWFHDQVFLYIKGYLYYRGFPRSVIKWAVLATLIGLVAGSLLSDRSFTKGPQIALLNAALRRPWLEFHLYQNTLFLARLGIKPTLLCEITRTEFELELAALADDPHATTAGRTADRFELYRKYAPLCAAFDPVHELERVYHTLVVMRPHPYSAALGQALTRLETLLHRALARVVAQEFGEGDPDAVFMPRVLTEDIRALLKIDVDMVERTGDVIAQELTLLQHIEERARLLMEAAYHVQQDFVLPKEVRRASVPGDSLPDPALPEHGLDAWGRIALDITLHFAWVVGDARAAQIYFEGCDSLSLLLITSGFPTAATRRYQALLGYADQRPDEPYPMLHLQHAQQLYARLLATSARHHADEWRSTLAYARESLGFSDDDLAFEAVERSLMFAGTDTFSATGSRTRE